MSASQPRSSRERSGGVGPLRDEHNARFATFLRAAWGQQSSEADVAEWRERDARSNPVEPGTEPPKWVFTRGDEIIGYLGSIPVRFVVDGREASGHWFKGFWVLPQYRSGPVGFAILQHALGELRMAASTLVAEPARRLMEAEGMSDLGTFYNRVRVLRTARLLRELDVGSLGLRGVSTLAATALEVLRRTRTTRVVGAALDGAVGLLVTARGRPRRDVTQARGWESIDQEHFDGAWQAFSKTVRATSVRDGAYLRWRYGTSERYEVVGVREEGALRAWAVVRRPSRHAEGRLKGLSVASLSDVLFPANEPHLGLAAVAGAERLAREIGADALLCSGTHPALERVLAKRGFLAAPPNLHFLVHDPDGHASATSVGDWWLTRGDGQADESL